MFGWFSAAILGIGFVVIGPLRAQDLVTSGSTVAVPFELTSDFLIVVEGQVGNLRGLKFIVDTGATHSVIDRSVALKLRLRRHAAKVMNFDRFVSLEYADVPDLQIGPLQAHRLRIKVANLLEYSEFAKGVDGLVGLDVLARSQKFTIDYMRRNLYIQRTVGEISFKVPSLLVVPVMIQGTTLRLGVDTGLSEILLFADRLKKYGGNIRTVGEPEPVVMGRIQGKKLALPGVQLGRHEAALQVILIDGPPERVIPEINGFLGIASFHPSIITFDFANRILQWQ